MEKTRFGFKSRKSADLDMGVPIEVVDLFWGRLNGLVSGPFTFTPYLTPARNKRLRIESDLFTEGELAVHLDLSQNPRLLKPEMVRLLPEPGDHTYRQPEGLWLPAMPILENAAGKLGRWYQRCLIRDLHDLALLVPELRPHISELAELLVCCCAIRKQQQPLIDSSFGEEPVFRILDQRMGFADAHNSDGFVYEDLLYVPEKSDAEKAALIKVWLEDVLLLTDEIEESIVANERLLRIAQRAPDAAELTIELETELRSRYDTEEEVYRTGRLRTSAV